MLEILESGYQIDNRQVQWAYRHAPRRIDAAERKRTLAADYVKGREPDGSGWLSWPSQAKQLAGHRLTPWWRIRWEPECRLNIDIPIYGFPLLPSGTRTEPAGGCHLPTPESTPGPARNPRHSTERSSEKWAT